MERLELLDVLGRRLGSNGPCSLVPFELRVVLVRRRHPVRAGRVDAFITFACLRHDLFRKVDHAAAIRWQGLVIKAGEHVLDGLHGSGLARATLPATRLHAA